MKYAILMIQEPTGYNAMVPDLRGVYAAGATVEETRARLAGAIEMHIRALRADNEPVPEPSQGMELLEIAV